MRAILLCLVMGAAHAETVTVYSLSSMNITGSTQYQRINIDQGQMLLKELGAGLPDDLDAAVEVARNRMSDNSNVALLNKVGEGFNGLIQAYANGIDKLPAIVIDDSLIYGITDVDYALELYRLETSEEEETEPLIPMEQILTVDLETIEGDETEASVESLEEGETIGFGDIFSSSINFTCLNYEVVGVCIWLTYTYFSVEIDYSLQVRHRIPDAVVSSYSNTGENPWTDVAGYSSPISGYAEEGGTNKERNFTNQETALLFRNADVIGSPGSLWIEALSETGYFCEPMTTPMYPYFLSTLDYMWRDPILETVSTIANWNRWASFGKSKWGPIYPRHGFINQGHPYKAEAVIAQRAADITTREDQLHLYIPMTEEADGPEGQGQWSPPPVVEGDEETHAWQQLIPSDQSEECIVFADQSDQTSGPDDPFKERLNDPKGIAWNLWRPYTCCEQEGAVLIFNSAGE